MKINFFLFFLLFLMINSCAKEDPDEKSKSFEEKITGTFKLKSFKIKEIDNSSSSEFEYNVNHVSTDNYSYFGNTINKENDLFIRTLFGKVNLTSSGRDNITFDCSGHKRSFEKENDLIKSKTTITNGCNNQNYLLSNISSYNDNFTSSSDTLIEQIAVQDNGTSSRINTAIWEKQ